MQYAIRSTKILMITILTLGVLLSLSGPAQAAAWFGFIGTPGGFGFGIGATDFDDNIVLWTRPSFLDSIFFVEWVDAGLTWNSLSGSLTAADIANEAADRGLLASDFEGFFVWPEEGDDCITCDGTGTIGIKPGAPSSISQTPIPYSLVGIPAYVYPDFTEPLACSRVPVPSSMLLVSSGLLGIAWLRRKFRK